MTDRNKCVFCNKEVIVCSCIPDDDWKQATAHPCYLWNNEDNDFYGYMCFDCQKSKSNLIESWGSSGIPADVEIYLKNSELEEKKP